MATGPHLDIQIYLNRKEDLRLREGHPWVFSNEIREVRGNPGIGDTVEILDAGGRSLGVGFYHPHSLIAVRLLSTTVREIDFDFFSGRLSAALATRSQVYPECSAYRVVYGESDHLPGLIIDRYNEYLVVQTFSAGMDTRLGLICDVLESVLHPAGIVERNESPLRELEGLPPRKGVLRGSVSRTTIREYGIEFLVDLLEGQKTGFYFDQRENRRAVGSLSRGLEVLDCFCNDGGFSLSAAAAGATAVLGIDSSDAAVSRARENARLNGLNSCTFESDEVFERLKSLRSEGRSYDLIVLDPPSFTRNKKSVTNAKRGYRELHTAALGVLRRPGFLCTASCSHHITTETFLSLVDKTCRDAGRPLQLLDWRGAAPDHPVLPSVPETRYLKFGIFRAP